MEASFDALIEKSIQQVEESIRHYRETEVGAESAAKEKAAGSRTDADYARETQARRAARQRVREIEVAKQKEQEREEARLQHEARAKEREAERKRELERDEQNRKERDRVQDRYRRREGEREGWLQARDRGSERRRDQDRHRDWDRDIPNRAEGRWPPQQPASSLHTVDKPTEEPSKVAVTLAPEEEQALDQKALDLLLKESSELATRNRIRPELERSESLEPPPRRNQPAKTIPSGSPSGRQSDRAITRDAPPDHSQPPIPRSEARSRSRSRQNYHSRRNSSISQSRQTSMGRGRSHGGHQDRREHERGTVTRASSEGAHDVPTSLRRSMSPSQWRVRGSNHAQRKRQTFGRHDSSGRNDRRSLSSSPELLKHHRSYRQRSTSSMSFDGGGRYRERRRGVSREVSRSKRTQASWEGRERHEGDRHQYRGRDGGRYDPMDIDRYEPSSTRRGSPGQGGLRRLDHHLSARRLDDDDHRGRLTMRRSDEREREREWERGHGRERERDSERGFPHRQLRDMKRDRRSRSRSPRFRLRS